MTNDTMGCQTKIVNQIIDQESDISQRSRAIIKKPTVLTRSAKDFADLIRQHWDVENRLHWSLDVIFNEDRSRICKDHAPANMASLRRLALNQLQQDKTKPISLMQRRLLCSLDENY